MEHIFSHVYGFDCVRCSTRIGIEHDWRHLFRYQRRPLRYAAMVFLGYCILGKLVMELLNLFSLVLLAIPELRLMVILVMAESCSLTGRL
ncbi:hypothetical protein QL285_067482 [Trifolium repens]|nr:hypothetical protein QL285_067482 [Trifolium repens]